MLVKLKGGYSMEDYRTYGYGMGKEYGLSMRQETFVLYYLMHWNATWAYQQAYKCSYRTANVNGGRLLKQRHVYLFKERTRFVVCIHVTGDWDKYIKKIEYLDSIGITEKNVNKKWQRI